MRLCFTFRRTLFGFDFGPLGVLVACVRIVWSMCFPRAGWDEDIRDETWSTRWATVWRRW
jgi:hypothetical protein